MYTKDEILEEIRRTSKENGGKPLGVVKFESETGIKPYDWDRYWPRFTDAQREAGFIPNALNAAYDDGFVLENWVAVTRELGRIPTDRDLRFKAKNNKDFPSSKTMLKFGSKAETVNKLLEYADKKGYGDIKQLCGSVLKKAKGENDAVSSENVAGEVYLFKHGRYYKIGKTNDTVRRGAELRIQLPEKMDLIHSIKTDDPSGVEAYWHRRFEAKRMNGEWFDLSSSEIKAFKRWRKIV